MKKKKSVTKHTGKYNRTRGNNFETKIARELRELGYTGVVTSRSESKNMDNNKIDIIDTDNKLPCYLQLKKTIAYPSYFKIYEQCSLKDKPFCIIWAAQEKKEKNICTKGELVILPKEYFYELIKLK